MDKLREECGVVGIYSTEPQDIGFLLYVGLIALQHRGQESAGIITVDNGKFNAKKGQGLVQEVFTDHDIKRLVGQQGVAHVRYSTTGANSEKNIQPFYFVHKNKNIAYAHNGNLVNFKHLRRDLEASGAIFRTESDSEIVAHLLAKYLQQGEIAALKQTFNAIKGAFSLAMIIGDKLIAVRDPFGIRPLVLGRLGNAYVVASESVAFDSMGAQFIRDVEAGEMLIIDQNGVESIKYCDDKRVAHSAFEYVYFARPDSVIDGISVYKTRVAAGRLLAQNHPVDADIVIPVPDSGRSAAIGYAEVSGLTYGEGLIKNKYVGRTFIQPTQAQREMALKIKLNVLREIIAGKRVVLIDDSIVRGTTSKKIVSLLKASGASEVHLRVSSPMVKYPSYYGIDTPNAAELVASQMGLEQIRNMIGADSLAFLTVDELVSCIGLKKDELCLDIFTGDYPVPIDDLDYRE
ncbi:MAG: amidophosphoribosyltransferase [Clostridiales bacterium]|nr:MAG: amidophosphoribosyltransferase [Clostridiales bacterium]